MGIWNGLRFIAAKTMNRDSSDRLSDSNGIPLRQAVTKISDTIGVQKLADYVPNHDHRDKIIRIFTGLGKFAVDSAVDESLKGFTGGVQVYKIVKEGLKDQPLLRATKANEKPETALLMEEMQAKMEKLQKELSFIKQQNEESIQRAKELNASKETSAEANEGTAPLKPEVRKVFIRSRL